MPMTQIRLISSKYFLLIPLIERAVYHICTDLKWEKYNQDDDFLEFKLPRMIFLMFVSPTVSRKNKVSPRVALTILSRGITSSSRPNLETERGCLGMFIQLNWLEK